MIEVISEIGINHNGDMSRAIEMIHVSKECGADVAKFQIYDPEWLLDENDSDLRDCWDMILKTKLTRQWVELLKGECDSVGIEFFASVFRPEVVEWTEEIGMRRYKIASRSIYDKELAEAIAATGKPVIISYGMVKEGKVPAIVEILGMDERLKHLYCVAEAEYPTPFEKFRFFTSEGQSIFGPLGYDGFSDHSVGIMASIVAMYFGALIIEKHFTLNKQLPGPDHTCSVTPSELKLLCKVRRNWSEVLLQMYPTEH